MTQLKIKGHSGCNLHIDTDGGRLFVRKSSPSEDYVKRLKHQYEKQFRFCRQLSKTGITTPTPTWKNDEIIMPYVHSKSFIEYFERASINDLKHTIKKIISFIEEEIADCDETIVHKRLFLDKIDSIRENLLKKYPDEKDKMNAYCDKIEAKINSYDDILLPIGFCHGDLTFSNVLFTDNNIYLIDFLDSFIDTPLQDIVKLRQDTVYHWSLMMSSERYNEVHMNTVLQYIDNEIDKVFSKTAWYANFYTTLQYINILRILPYVKEDHVYARVCEILNSIEL